MLSCVARGLASCPCLSVKAFLGEERAEAGVEDDDGTEGRRKQSEVRRRRGGIGTGTTKICDGVHWVHISDQMGRRQDRAARQGRDIGHGQPARARTAGGQPERPSQSTGDLLASH